MSLIVSADDPDCLAGLEAMLPSSGRPLFEEDVEPRWFELHQAIEWLEPPESLERVGQRLLLIWRETEHAAITLKKALEAAGCTLEFLHQIEGDGIPQDFDDDVDFYGAHYLNTEAGLKHLSQLNAKTLLPDYPHDWDDYRSEDDLPKLTAYLMRR